MCEVMDDLLERSREQGMEQGEIRRSIFIIKNLVMNMGITTEEAVEMIGISEVERERYLELASNL